MATVQSHDNSGVGPFAALWRFLRRRFLGQPSCELPLIRIQEALPTFERIVFICGLHRSGTTLLENLLRSCFSVSVLRAPVPENEGQHLQDVYPQAFHFGGAGQFAFAPQMHPQPPPAADAKKLRSRILACWSQWVSGTSDVLLEKSPPNLTKIAYLRTIFPGARFVIMTRDPRVVAAATRKWSQTSLLELIFHWQVAYSSALQDRRSDCYHVKYEDLCVQPDRVLGEIGEFLSLRRLATGRPTDARFADIRDSNSEYLNQLPEFHLGDGIWQQFGYQI